MPRWTKLAMLLSAVVPFVWSAQVAPASPPVARLTAAASEVRQTLPEPAEVVSGLGPRQAARVVTVTRQSDGGLSVQVDPVVGRQHAADEVARAVEQQATVSVELDSRVHATEVEPRQSEQWGLPAVEAPAVWPRTMGQGVTVAVLDTGVDGAHEDLAGQVLPGVNLVGNETSVRTEDGNGHGTHVAGIIAAARNGLGAVGVAPAARILPVRVLDSEGAGYAGDVAEGIIWAVDHGASVINLSLGGPRPSRAQEMAIQYAVAQGVSVIAAAGNSGPAAQLEYPAAFPDVLAVAALTPQSAAASFSSRGTYVDLAAPGTMILSAQPGDTYASRSGTSVASPFVAGAASLLLGLRPMAPAEVHSLLTRTAIDVDAVGPDVATGSGRLCVRCAVEAALGAPPAVSAPTVVLAPTDSEPAVDLPAATPPRPAATRPVKRKQSSVRLLRGKRAVLRAPAAFSRCTWSRRTLAGQWRPVAHDGCRLRLGKAHPALDGMRVRVDGRIETRAVYAVLRVKIIVG